MGLPALIWAPLWLSSAVVTVSNLSGTPADMLQPDEGTYCQITAAGNVVVTINCGTAKTINCLAITGELLAGLSISVDRSSDGGSWSSVALISSSIVNNLANIIWFTASQSYQYFRLTITAAPVNLRIYHIAPAPAYLWPKLVDGFDLVGYQPDVTVLKSPQGHPLGIQRNACLRNLTIDFGQMLQAQSVSGQYLLDECINHPQCFFFQPDSANSPTYFGHANMGKKYGIVQKIGRYTMTPIEFISRVP
jgi:hypothetical protein